MTIVGIIIGGVSAVFVLTGLAALVALCWQFWSEVWEALAYRVHKKRLLAQQAKRTPVRGSRMRQAGADYEIEDWLP